MQTSHRSAPVLGRSKRPYAPPYPDVAVAADGHTPKPRECIRLGRSKRPALINLSYFSELRSMFNGEHVVVLRDGSRLPLTRGVRELEDLLKFS